MTHEEKADNYIKVVTKQMESIGVLEDVDKQNLELLKQQVNLYYWALEDIEKNGITARDKVNRATVNPAFNVQRSAIQNITSLLRELSISARQRRFLIQNELVKESDPMDEFLNRMNTEL